MHPEASSSIAKLASNGVLLLLLGWRAGGCSRSIVITNYRAIGSLRKGFCVRLVTRVFNPKGIASSSPGLRGTSYPGCNGDVDSTLKGLRRFFVRGAGQRRNPFRVGTSRDIFPG